jgi:hypothetical protein
MSRIVTWFLVAAVVGLDGCGGTPGVSTQPLSDEQKAKVKAEDQEIDRAELSGSGTATTGKKKR